MFPKKKRFSLLSTSYIFIKPLKTLDRSIAVVPGLVFRMKSQLSFVALLYLISLPSSTVYALPALDPEDIHLITRGTDYTFHSICADYKNPDLFFDEWVLNLLSLLSI